MLCCHEYESHLKTVVIFLIIYQLTYATESKRILCCKILVFNLWKLQRLSMSFCVCPIPGQWPISLYLHPMWPPEEHFWFVQLSHCIRTTLRSLQLSKTKITSETYVTKTRNLTNILPLEFYCFLSNFF